MRKEENLFIFNLTFGSCRSLYGAKKIFHSIVGSNGVAWVVRVWKRKLFIINLAEWHFLSLYGAEKTIFFFRVLWQLNKAIQYLRQTASRWNRYAMTFPLQKRATTYLCSCKRLVLFYRYDLCCQIMILPYSHGLSVKSVARNGYGYIG